MRGMPGYVDRAVRGSSPRSVISVIAVLTIAALLFIQTGWIIPTPTAQAAGGGTDEDLQLQIRNLLDHTFAGSWGNTLNSVPVNPTPAQLAAGATSMKNLYLTDATLLPTVKQGIWVNNLADGAANAIHKYFGTYFLPTQPRLLAIPVADQHVVVMGDWACNHGLYTFRFPALPGQIAHDAKARFSFVYKKVNPNLGWNDPGNAKIIQHHSSRLPTCQGDVNTAAVTPDGLVNTLDLLTIINKWNMCP